MVVRDKSLANVVSLAAKGLRASEAIFLPAIIKREGPRAIRRFYEFFTANIRNRNTREAYHRALADMFAWLDDRNVLLIEIEPILVAAYIEYLGTIYSKPTVKQHLAAIRMCFDWLVVGQILPMNPSASVRGPKYVVKKGKTLNLALQ
jgi:integrase/recombinase XerD